jgi:hypothetical protein
MKFTVDRKTWLRGGGPQDSYLLTPDGMRCCIGFVAQQCGVADEDILNIVTISHIAKKDNRSKFPEWMDDRVSLAYVINDRREISEDDREAQLKDLFLKNGDEIEFV